MTAMDKYVLRYMEDSKLEEKNNKAMQESFRIVMEEVDYFFHTKEHLIDLFLEGIDYAGLSPQSLQYRFSKVFYPKQEVTYFLSRLETKIQRELLRGQTPIDFKLVCDMSKLLDIENYFLSIEEAARTFTLSHSAEKAVDFIWKKSNFKVIPKELGMLSSRFKPGSYVLSSLGCSTKEVQYALRKRLAKQVGSILRQNKKDMTHFIKKEIIIQTLHAEDMGYLIIKRDKTKTA